MKVREMFACPKCGEPLEFGAGQCPKCQVRLDPATGKVRENVSDHELHASMEAARQKGKTGLIMMIPGIIMISVGFMIGSTFGIIVAIAGTVLALFGYGKSYNAKVNFKKELGNTMIPQVLSEIFENVEFQEAGKISEDIINNTEMHFNFTFNRISGNDYLKARYKGVDLEMSDITLDLVTTYTERDSDGDTETREEVSTKFNGQWIIFDFHKKLVADLNVYEGKKLFERNKIQTENEAFNKKYGIACDDEHSAFYVLTPHMMEHILKMDDMAGGNTYLRFQKDGKVHMAVSNNKNLFEIKNIKEASIDSLRGQFRNEIRYVTDMVDQILSEETVFAK